MKENILIVIVSFLFAYIIQSFIKANINFLQWKEFERVSYVFFAIWMALLGIVITKNK